jgi:DNA-binding MarR family transcriptional regulator
MIDPNSALNSGFSRNELLQRTVEQLFSVMKQIHREVMPQGAVLSPPQARLVFMIARNKDKISVKDLANKANMTPGAITQFVDALLKKGLVIREENPEDRRVVLLKLTPAALEQMGQFRQQFLVSAARAFDALSMDDLEKFNALLSKVSLSPVKDENANCEKKI